MDNDCEESKAKDKELYYCPQYTQKKWMKN